MFQSSRKSGKYRLLNPGLLNVRLLWNSEGAVLICTPGAEAAEFIALSNPPTTESTVEVKPLLAAICIKSAVQVSAAALQVTQAGVVAGVTLTEYVNRP